MLPQPPERPKVTVNITNGANLGEDWAHTAARRLMAQVAYRTNFAAFEQLKARFSRRNGYKGSLKGIRRQFEWGKQTLGSNLLDSTSDIRKPVSIGIYFALAVKPGLTDPSRDWLYVEGLSVKFDATGFRTKARNVAAYTLHATASWIRRAGVGNEDDVFAAVRNSWPAIYLLLYLARYETAAVRSWIVPSRAPNGALIGVIVEKNDDFYLVKTAIDEAMIRAHAPSEVEALAIILDHVERLKTTDAIIQNAEGLEKLLPAIDVTRFKRKPND